jgi:NTP pyrophosphatase (non-canonical NTP hydrolase)
VSNEQTPAAAAASALVALDELTRRLRVECPWDREQDERTIVPHTLEEAYELADAAQRRDDGKLLDELGDVLFQVHFLSLLLEERGAGSLADVAEHVRQKLIRRHPHVFGETEVANAGEVLRNWDAIKATEAGREPGIFGEVPENLPSALYARKVQRGGVDRLRRGGRALRRGRGAARGGRVRGRLRRRPVRGRRRPAVLGRQRRAQAEGRPGARAAVLGR